MSLSAVANDVRVEVYRALVHFGVPAAQWYDDIGFTLANMLDFRSEDHLARWLGRCKSA